MRTWCILIMAAALSACVTNPQVRGGSETNNADGAKAKELVQGSPTQAQPVAEKPQGASTHALTPDEELFLSNYLAELQYMVYYDEQSGIDPRMAKIAVGQANRYLIEKLGLNVVDFDQIEKNKKDQLSAYQAETGGSIDIIQYIAQKYNADVYVEISFNTTSSARNGKFYASAYGTMKMYNPSTAQLLGSVTFQSPEVFSPSSAQAAVSNAVSASVWNGMPTMSEQSKMLVKNSMAKGIRYEIVLQKTPDSKQLSLLRRALGAKAREAEQLFYSSAETKFAVYIFAKKDKIEDMVYEAAERAGLPHIYLVYSRGRSFTFNSGL